jgi:dTDP-glucose 4,6-dehydratase
MSETVLITGGAGFAGAHVVEHMLKNTDFNIVVLDKLTYASNGLNRLREIKALGNGRLRVLTADFSQPLSKGVKQEIGFPTYIVHMGAETHVDNSIVNAEPFVRANVLGTMYMLEYAREVEPKTFVYFSTDEVFGPAPEGIKYSEEDRYNATNPYAATKAGGEQLALSYAVCYNLPVLVTHTMNLFGERQNPEKFIPQTIKKVLEDKVVIIHANKTKTEAGKRHYIHCRNMADALLFLLKLDWQREKVNIVGEKEVDNLTLARTIARIVGKPLRYEMVDFHSSRPGHDLRYALDGSKLQKLGWLQPKGFEKSLETTIQWTLDHPEWLI